MTGRIFHARAALELLENTTALGLFGDSLDFAFWR